MLILSPRASRLVRHPCHRLEPNGTLPVHLLRLQHICPRLAYLSARREKPPPIEALAMREMALSVPGADGEMEARLRQRWEALAIELPTIYPDLDPAEAEAGLAAMDARVRGLCAAWGEWARCDPRAGALARPEALDLYLASGRLRLHGWLDAVAERDGRRVPVVARGGGFPPQGVFGGDRAQLAAFAMLMEEAGAASEAGGAVEEGWVLYFGAGELRAARLGARDRRRVWHLARGLQAVARGEMPAAHREGHCAGCAVRERCGSAWRTLDRVLGMG